MTDYTAQIKSKGLDSTGVTEEIARSMYNKLGSHGMAIVEYTIDSRSETTDGTHKVQLSLTQVEPIVDNADLEDHVRELIRTLYYNRGHADGQLAIDSTIGAERTTADVLASGAHHRPHPYVTGALSEDGEKALCDVCGLLETAPIHSHQEPLPDDEDDEDDDPELTQDDEEDEDPDTTLGDTWPDPHSDEIPPTRRRLVAVADPFA